MKPTTKILNSGNIGLVLVLVCPFIFLFFYIATERSNYDLGRDRVDSIWNITRAILEVNELENEWSAALPERDVKALTSMQQLVLSYLDSIHGVASRPGFYRDFDFENHQAVTDLVAGWRRTDFETASPGADILRLQHYLEDLYLKEGTSVISNDWLYRNIIIAGSLLVFLVSFFLLVRQIKFKARMLSQLEESQSMLIESRQTALDTLQKLEESKDLLIESRQSAITKIASNVFHEFSNCLWMIALLTDEAKNEPTAWEKNKALGKIHSYLRETREMLVNLRTYIRGEKLATEILDLGKSIIDLRPLIETITGPEISLKMDVSSDCAVNVIPDHIRQIVTNLAKNAVEAMPQGGRLEISVWKSYNNPNRMVTSAGGQWVVLTVADTGTGMSEEVQKSIFHPFFSIHKEGGTGMGLTGVENWVQGANGSIHVESTLGQGSSFSVYLPLSQDRREAKQSDDTHPEEVPARQPRILLIDDEQEALDLQALSLRREQFDVHAISNPRDISEEEIRAADLIISDIRMPYVDGVSLASELIKIKPLPVIFLTGDELSPDTEQKIKNLFPKAWTVFKPVCTGQLSVIAREALDARP